MEKKKTLKKNKKKKKTLHDIITSIRFLTILFCLLIIIVSVLVILLWKKEQDEKEKQEFHMSIPVCEKLRESSFSIDAYQLLQEKEYIFKIKNYHQEEINQEELEYSIMIENYTSAEIVVTELGNDQNLMVDQKGTIIEHLHLKKDEKDERFFRVQLKEGSIPKQGEMITITIKS